jgi:transposase
VGHSRPVAAATQARRASAHGGPAPHPQRHLLRCAQRVSVALTATIVRPLVHRVRVLSPLVSRRRLAADPYDLEGTRPPAGWALADAGRKRHLLVDTLGLVIKAHVHPADLQDRAGAPRLLLTVADTLPRLELIWADSAYVGPLQTWTWETLGWRLQIVERPGGRGQWLPADQESPLRLRGFQLLPRPWVVERTFAWIGRNRRMSRDYEFLPATSEAWIYLSMIRLMLKRLAHEQVHPAFHYRRVA